MKYTTFTAKIASAMSPMNGSLAEVPADQFETAGRNRKPVAARGLGEHHIRPVDPDALRSARDVKQ